MSSKIHGNKKFVCKDTGEVVVGYTNYLSTKHWRQLRVKVAEHNNYTCLRCGGVFKDNFVIHHNSYAKIGNEDLNHLGFYCSRCHVILHQERKNKKVFNKGYRTQITHLMHDMNEDDIGRVLDFIKDVRDKKQVFHLATKSKFKNLLIEKIEHRYSYE